MTRKCITCPNPALSGYVRCTVCLERRRVIKRRHYYKRHARLRIRGAELDRKIPLPPRAPRPPKTHCPAGHERTPENSYFYSGVVRVEAGKPYSNVKCKICTKDRVLASRAAGYPRA